MEDKTVKVGKYELKVVRDLCISAGTCVAVSPQVFELDGENKAIIKDGATDIPENIILAAQACPVRAVIVVDTETGAQVWPLE